MEEFITRFPQHLNLRIDDGLTPLHVAAVANHRDIVTYLAEQVNEPVGGNMYACDALYLCVSDWQLYKLCILSTVSSNKLYERPKNI